LIVEGQKIGNGIWEKREEKRRNKGRRKMRRRDEGNMGKEQKKRRV
jgi:hypothetical protein